MREYPTLDSYAKHFNLDEVTIADMTHLAEAIDPTVLEDTMGRDECSEIIRAQIAEELYCRGAYYNLYGQKRDKVLSEALSTLRAEMAIK